MIIGYAGKKIYHNFKVYINIRNVNILAYPDTHDPVQLGACVANFNSERFVNDPSFQIPWNKHVFISSFIAYELYYLIVQCDVLVISYWL